MTSRVPSEAQMRGLRRISTEDREATRAIIRKACLALEGRGVEPSINGVLRETSHTIGRSAVASRDRHNDIVRERSAAFRASRGLEPRNARAASDAPALEPAPKTLEEAIAALAAARTEVSTLAGQIADVRSEADELKATVARQRIKLNAAAAENEHLRSVNQTLKAAAHERLPIHRAPHVGPVSEV